jgi:hypothetical protein
MPARQEEQDKYWPVKYPVKTPVQELSRHRREKRPLRWTATDKAGTREVQRRLLWLLLSVEAGMALAAACVLPLLFLRLPIEQEGAARVLAREVGRLSAPWAQVTCLVLALPIPILLLAFSLMLWWFLRLRSQEAETRNHTVDT